MFRQNLTRMLGSLLWVTIPVVSFLLFLPHQVEMNREAALVLLFCMLLVNITTIILPYKESLLSRYFTLLISLLLLSLIALLCGSISFSGGVRSPLFPLLLLITAFGCGLISSLGAAAAISGTAAAGHLAASTLLSHLNSGDVQLLCAQIFFLLLIPFLFERLSAESREQARERAKAMEELRNLAEMNRAASGFVSAVSFEMRTPLTSILGFSEMLVSKRLAPEMEREYVEIIRREADNLNRLVEDLLDISRLESGKVRLNKEPARIDQLINAGLPALRPTCDPDQVALTIPADLPEVMMDVKRMKRVLDGVFGFIARRFGSGTEIRASVKAEGREMVFTLNIRNREASVLRENGSRLLLSHWDQSEEDLDLAIARRIITAHRGSFSVIKASGGWLTIVIRLPLIDTGELAAPSLVPGALRGETTGSDPGQSRV